MSAGHRVPFKIAGREVPAAALVDQLVAVRPGGRQGGVAIRGDGEKQSDATLGRIDAVDFDLMIDGDQALLVTAVECRAQIGEHLVVTAVPRAGMPERGDPAVTVT